MDSNLIDKMKLNLDNNLINKKNKINNEYTKVQNMNLRDFWLEDLD